MILEPQLATSIAAPAAQAKLAQVTRLGAAALLKRGVALAPTGKALAAAIGVNHCTLSRVRHGRGSLSADALALLRIYVALGGVDMPAVPCQRSGARTSPGTNWPRLRLLPDELDSFKALAKAAGGVTMALATAIEAYLAKHEGTDAILAPALPEGTTYLRVTVAPELLASLETRTAASDRAAHLYAAVTTWMATQGAT